MDTEDESSYSTAVLFRRNVFSHEKNQAIIKKNNETISLKQTERQMLKKRTDGKEMKSNYWRSCFANLLNFGYFE